MRPPTPHQREDDMRVTQDPSPGLQSPWGSSRFFSITETRGFGQYEVGGRYYVYFMAVLETHQNFFFGFT